MTFWKQLSSKLLSNQRVIDVWGCVVNEPRPVIWLQSLSMELQQKVSKSCTKRKLWDLVKPITAVQVENWTEVFGKVNKNYVERQELLHARHWYFSAKREKRWLVIKNFPFVKPLFVSSHWSLLYFLRNQGPMPETFVGARKFAKAPDNTQKWHSQICEHSQTLLQTFQEIDPRSLRQNWKHEQQQWDHFKETTSEKHSWYKTTTPCSPWFFKTKPNKVNESLFLCRLGSVTAFSVTMHNQIRIVRTLRKQLSESGFGSRDNGVFVPTDAD